MKAGVLGHPGPLYASWPTANFREHHRLLKNFLYARFDLRSGTKHAVFGALRARFVVTLSSTPTFSTS